MLVNDTKPISLFQCQFNLFLPCLLFTEFTFIHMTTMLDRAVTPLLKKRLSKYKLKCCLVYPDQITIYKTSFY